MGAAGVYDRNRSGAEGGSELWIKSKDGSPVVAGSVCLVAHRRPYFFAAHSRPLFD